MKTFLTFLFPNVTGALRLWERKSGVRGSLTSSPALGINTARRGADNAVVTSIVSRRVKDKDLTQGI